jgi:putative hydrolase of the HAD superfamily
VSKLKSSVSSQFKYILFDLDETLYPKEAGLMNTIGERIMLYMTQKIGIPADDVAAKKRVYYQKYGTSLRGLMEEYQIDPAEYLRFVHDIDPLNFFGISPPLDKMLEEIPLRKVVFTNADIPHAERVLNTLQVRHHFDMIIDVCAVDYKCKPDPHAYKKALTILGVSGPECILVDDTPRNLIPAKDLGMTTILVNDDKNGTSSAIDYKVRTVFHVGRVLKKLLSMEGPL